MSSTSIQADPRCATSTAIPSLRSNFRWAFVGNVTYTLCQWGMISILAKIGNSALVGQFALALAISAPVFMLTNLQLRSVQATDARGDFHFSDYFTLRLAGNCIGWIAVLVIVAAGHFARVVQSVILLVACAKVFESLSDVVAGLLQRQERLDIVATSLILRGVGSFLAFGSIFFFYRSLPWAVFSMIVLWGAVFIVYDLKWIHTFVGTRRCFHWELIRIRKLLILSLPLGLVMALISLNVNIPRYMLEHFSGPNELGIFASLAYLVTAVTLVVNALGQSVSTRLSRMFAEKQFTAFKLLILKLSSLGLVIILAGVPLALAFGRPVLTMLYKPEYGEHTSVLAIMVVTAGITTVGSFVGYGITAAREFRIQVPIAFLATLSTAVAGWFLIPRFGLTGAAVALLLSSVSVTLTSSFAMRFIIESNP